MRIINVPKSQRTYSQFCVCIIFPCFTQLIHVKDKQVCPAPHSKHKHITFVAAAGTASCYTSLRHHLPIAHVSLPLQTGALVRSIACSKISNALNARVVHRWQPIAVRLELVLYFYFPLGTDKVSFWFVLGRFRFTRLFCLVP